MGYYSQFPGAIPLSKAGYVRVTHPCATRQQLYRSNVLLPFDLHVLGLPLAFILSQDQTLHGKSLLVPRKTQIYLYLRLFVLVVNNHTKVIDKDSLSDKIFYKFLP